METGPREREFQTRLVQYLNDHQAELGGATASWGDRLAYASVRFKYAADGKIIEETARDYETDILICHECSDGSWVPHVVIECKYGSINSHDLITYTKKADAHRALHPYLRYGIVVGGFAGELPFRMLAHGAGFDFMAVIPGGDQIETEYFAKLVPVLAEQVEASRMLWKGMQTGNRWKGQGVRIVHRPLVLG